MASRAPIIVIAAGVAIATVGWLASGSSSEPPPPASAPPPDVLSIALAPRDPPVIEATIVGPPASSYVLIDEAASASPTTVRDDPGTLGVVVVVEVDASWLHDTYEALGQALEHSGLAGIFGSRVVVITYDREARIARTAQPIANLGDDALDDEDTYLTQGHALAAAVLLAEQELDKLSTDRRALIVVGDGRDDNAAGANTLLTAARVRLHRLGIQVDAVSCGANSELPALVNARVAATPADLPKRMLEVSEHLAHRTIVTFDARQLAWDGTAHHLAVRVDGGDVDAGAIALPRWHETPVLRLATSIAGLALLAAGLTLRAWAARAR